MDISDVMELFEMIFRASGMRGLGGLGGGFASMGPGGGVFIYGGPQPGGAPGRTPGRGQFGGARDFGDTFAGGFGGGGFGGTRGGGGGHGRRDRQSNQELSDDDDDDDDDDDESDDDGPPAAPAKPKSEQLKDTGNELLLKGDLVGARRCYSDAIKLDPENHVLFSNRANAQTRLELYDLALADADECVRLNDSWPKGHGRRGGALAGLKRHQEAADAYSKAASLDITGGVDFLDKAAEQRELAAQGGASADASGSAGDKPKGPTKKEKAERAKREAEERKAHEEATRAEREAERKAGDTARKAAKEQARLDAKEAKARQAEERKRLEEEQKMLKVEEADAALQRLMLDPSHGPLSAEVERRKEHASAAVLAEAQSMIASLAEAIRAEKAERAQAQAQQRREQAALTAFQALVSWEHGAYGCTLASLKKAIKDAEPHAKAMPDLFGMELFEKRELLAALECVEEADKRERAAGSGAARQVPSAAPSRAAPSPRGGVGGGARPRSAEEEERAAIQRAERESREEARALAARKREEEARRVKAMQAEREAWAKAMAGSGDAGVSQEQAQAQARRAVQQQQEEAARQREAAFQAHQQQVQREERDRVAREQQHDARPRLGQLALGEEPRDLAHVEALLLDMVLLVRILERHEGLGDPLQVERQLVGPLADEGDSRKARRHRDRPLLRVPHLQREGERR